ncbi:MAG TPA: hypothetical protein VIM08_03865 [Arthrobacter sp.]|jgi:hypothetical protein
MTLANPEHSHSTLHQPVPAGPPSPPRCGKCRTDAYLDFDGFIPACYAVDRRGLRPSVVSYMCGHCGSYYSHEVPENWAPPGWQWYA